MALSVQPLNDPYNIQGFVSYAPQNSVAADSGGGTGTGTYYTGGGGSGGTAVSSVDPNQVALYDQSIGNTQNAINRTGSQLASGNSQIDASYQDAINQLLLGKNQANATYTDNKKTTATDYVGSKNTIRSQAGGSLSSLLRLLGSRGAGGSSAATITAPGAVARQATLQQNDVGSTFGANNRALDTNWNNYLTGYNNEVSSAGSQRQRSQQTLQDQINNNKAQLLQTLATLQQQKSAYQGGNPAAASQGSIDQANALLNSTANYNVAPITYQTQAYNAPSLGSYTVNPNAAPTFNGQTQSNDYTSPYLAALLGKKQSNTAAAPVGQ